MPNKASLEEARRLLGYDDPRRTQFERIVTDLRNEFDTLQRICRILLDDISAIDARICHVVHKTECDAILSEKLRDDRRQLQSVMDRIKHHEDRIGRLEYVAMTNHPSSVFTIHNEGGESSSTSVGHDVGHDINVKQDKPDVK